MTAQEVALREATQGAVEQFRDPAYISEMESIVPAGASALQILGAARRAVLEEPGLAAPNLRPALLRAALKSGADGLLPDKREAAFIYFGGKEPTIVYMPMIGGLRKIAAEHGWDLRGDIIRENDAFEDITVEGRVVHQKPRPGVERGKVEGAWAMAVHRTGQRKAKVMDLKQIEKVRQTSRAKDRGPWVDWWEEMALKTVARRLFKELPLDPSDNRLRRVIAALDDDGQDAVDALYGPVINEATGEIIDSEARPALGTSSRQAAADTAGEPGENGVDGGPNSPAEIIEPSDEELAALGADPVESVADTVSFPSGKYAGQTVREVYTSDGRGRGYVKWAAGATDKEGWRDEEFRAQVAAALAELEAEGGS